MFASTEQPLSTVPASPTAGGELLMDIGADATDIAAGMAGKDAQLQHPYSFAFDSDLLSLDGDLASMQTGALESIFGEGALHCSSECSLMRCVFCSPAAVAIAPLRSVPRAGGRWSRCSFQCPSCSAGLGSGLVFRSGWRESAGMF